MISALRVCTKCGAEIPADAPEGGCPGCLLESGLGLHPDAPLAVGDAPTVTLTVAPDGSSAGDVEENAAAAARQNKKPAHVAEILGELGDYELLEVVGRGGQGVVYRAHQKSLNRTVALKMISLGSWATEAHLKRFRREAEAAASLEHSGIVPIYEVGEGDGSCYFSMRFVEGGQLDAVMKREPISLRDATELIAKVARTVHYAHEHGILHRDIKPGNILLDAKSEPLLTDFGLARLVEAESTVTRTKEVMGTPSYMAPEQAMGNNAAVSNATDVYGLGAVLYQLLTRHPPFAGGTTYETIKLVLDTEPRQPRLLNPKIDRDLSTICLKCLEKDPKRRYPSALALAEDLEHWLKHEPILARPTGVFGHGKKWVRRNPSTAVLVTVLVAFAIGSGVMVWNRKSVPLIPKSVAVLPFSNLSKEEQNAYFADGVQDQILTDLSQIADLKVISRTSVMQYKSGVARNLRKIAEELGVAHVVEGSVQRAANKIRVSAQLIDARTDVHLWAQTYDRDLADVFAIQSEIAKAIADQLQAKLSPNQSNALGTAPTRDTEAYDLFLKGEYEEHLAENALSAESFGRAQMFYRQALARDPNFALAYARLAYSELSRHWFISNMTSAELAEVKSNIDRSLAIAPALADTHLALGVFCYWGYRDYDSALKALDRAIELQPNSATIRSFRAAIYRRRGDWQRSIAEFDQAAELDPRDSLIQTEIGVIYLLLHRWGDAEHSLSRALAIDPHNTLAARFLARTFSSTGDIRRARQAFEGVPVESKLTFPNDWGTIAVMIDERVYLDVLERRFADALKAWDVAPSDTSEARLRQLEARVGIQVLAGQCAAAKSECEQTRTLLEARLADQPEDPNSLIALAWVYVCLGRNADALRVAGRAADLLPIEKDAVAGQLFLTGLAEIEARTGKPDEAVKILRQLIAGPSCGTVSIARLKIDPVWDPIRNRPDFQQLLSGLEQIGPNK